MSKYYGKERKVMQRQMEAQCIVVQSTDANMYDANGGNGKISLGEDVEKVYAVIVHDDSVPSVISFAQADISISGGDVTVTGLALAADDTLIMHYKAQE